MGKVSQQMVTQAGLDLNVLRYRLISRAKSHQKKPAREEKDRRV
jgi:hypothetical protein